MDTALDQLEERVGHKEVPWDETALEVHHTQEAHDLLRGGCGLHLGNDFGVVEVWVDTGIAEGVPQNKELQLVHASFGRA